MLDRPTQIDFIIKKAYEITVFSGCMLATTTTKDLSDIENKITICSAFTALAGLGYDNLNTESGGILGQIEV